MVSLLATLFQGEILCVRNPLQDFFSLELSKAPAPTAGRIRVTMVISFFWERVRSVMDVVEADVAWKER